MEDKNFGILTSIDWNSNRWKALPTSDDIGSSKFEFVQDNNTTHTYLNFGHLEFSSDVDGYFYGLLPQFWTKTPQSKNISIIFIKSQNWQDKKNYIVGLYLFPTFDRKLLAPEIPGTATRVVNVKAQVKDIHLLDSFVELTNTNEKKFLPKDKELGKQGFNYLTKENAMKILDAMTALNPVDQKLSNIKFRLIKSIS